MASQKFLKNKVNHHLSIAQKTVIYIFCISKTYNYIKTNKNANKKDFLISKSDLKGALT